MPAKNNSLSITKKAVFGRKLPKKEQILAMANLLGPEITNLALGQSGGNGVPLSPEPSEVLETTGVLSMILKEMTSVVNEEILATAQKGGVTNLTKEEKANYLKNLSSSGNAIAEMERQWEKVSGFEAHRNSRAALVAAVTSAVVEAVTPAIEARTEDKQTHANKVDSMIFELEETGVKKLKQSNQSALDEDFNL